MKQLIILLLTCALGAVGLAEPTTFGQRVSFSYDANQWQTLCPRPPTGDILKIQNAEGDFTSLVMLEKKIAGGMSTSETRLKFIQGLSHVAANADPCGERDSNPLQNRLDRRCRRRASYLCQQCG